MAFNNVCRFNAASAGAANFVVASAVAGHLTPEQANVTNAKVYFYFASASDSSGQWEYGSGAYTIVSHTLARTTVTSTSTGTVTPVGFTAPPIVDVFPSSPPLLELATIAASAFVTGTVGVFQQTAAPTFWTKITTFNDAVLRVVSGAAGSGGSNAFSTVNAQTTVGNHALTIAEMPLHTHGENAGAGGSQLVDGDLSGITGNVPNVGTTTSNSAGSGAGHNHSITMNILFVDLILASKN